MEFEYQIKQGLESLNNKQLCRFAWLCGVRALPFLSVSRNFAYWRIAKRQKYLYGIFSALDVSASIAFLDDFAAKSAHVAKAADAVDFAAKNAAYAAYAAANAAKTAKATDAIDFAAKAAYAAARAAYAAKVGYINRFDYKSLLLNDIEAIKKKKLDECNHDINIYGELWDRFQESLKAIDCVYWAQFYANLFSNGFTIDKQQLEYHLGVPDEIKAEGAAAVGRYLERLGGKIERLNEARIIILGEKGAGKTSLARRLLNVDAEMPKEYESTEGVETSLWRFKGKDGADVNAHVWDFAGHSITHAVHSCFMSVRCLYIYVYNGRIERDNDPAYWLEQIRIHGGDSPVLFLINEKDDHRADIAEKTLKDEYTSIVGYYRVDIGSEDKAKLKEFRQIIMDTVSNNPSWNNQVVSMEAYKIKNELRKRFDKTNSPNITRDEFDEIAQNCGAFNGRIEDILNDLHTLGICLWYNKPEMEDFNMLVLNPDWITNGIYRIINESFKEHKHKLTTSKGTEILKDDKCYEYPRDMVAYLFKLMRLYELAFFENTDNIFIPGILPIDRSDGLPAFDDPKDRLTMSFVVDKALPPSITARIIVQRSGEIFDEKLLWRKGAVLKYQGGNTIALIIESSRSITISIKGTEKTAYIASLRETIKAIFDEYKVIKPDLLYEVLLPEKPEKSELPLQLEKEKPLMFSEEDLKGYIKENRSYFDAPNSRIIPLDETGRAYAIPEIKIYLEVNVDGSSNVNVKHGNVAYKSPGAIVGAVVNQILPDTVPKDQFKQILQMLEKFLESEQAGELPTKNTRALKAETDKARKLGFKEGWERLHGFLSDAANITTIGTAIATFLAANPKIPEAVRSVFACFKP